MAIQFFANSDYLTVEITGQYVKDDFIDLAQQVNKLLNEHGVDKIFVDMDNFDLFTFKNIDRFLVTMELVDKIPKFVKTAIYSTSREHINFFAENVAVNRGLVVKIFFDKDSAMQWLNE